MYLFLSIFLCSILGFVFLLAGPQFGAILVFGVIGGCLFRGVYLLNEIHKSVQTLTPQKNKVQEVYDNYLKEKDLHS